jgi:two-component system, NtrC family, response regulator HydG
MYNYCMFTTAQSPEDEWTFFKTVARAAFTNPFSEDRDRLDLIIGRIASGSTTGEVLDAVLTRIRERINQLRKKGKADLGSYEKSRREIMRGVILFHVFHNRMNDFDALIQTQLKDGDVPARVPFARQTLSELQSFGFSNDEAIRYFAEFYQLRRAFYFIKNGLVGSSPSMRKLRKHLWDCVFTHDIRFFETRLWDRMQDFSVLLLGETGTGKGSAAAAIGRSGFIPYDPLKNSFTESFTHNFVAINLSQYSEGVLESELFGHKKGAFTGAVDNHEGLFSRCAPHGAIFLDEIGDIGTAVQIKLLQVLQDRVFFPVGSHVAKCFTGRIMAATNQSLDELRQSGKFRDDLFFRLCSDEILIPTLRDRLAEDSKEIDVLLGSILSRLYGEMSDREIESLRSALARDVGQNYGWPGNVRELEQAVKRIILTGRYHRKDAVQKDGSRGERLALGLRNFLFDGDTLLAEYCASIYERFGTYEQVSRITKLDRRTAKKYVQMGLKR